MLDTHGSQYICDNEFSATISLSFITTATFSRAPYNLSIPRSSVLDKAKSSPYAEVQSSSVTMHSFQEYMTFNATTQHMEYSIMQLVHHLTE